MGEIALAKRHEAVSYTHLDVYKRQVRALEHLEKAELELVRAEGIHVVKRLAEALIALPGQTCDEIEM